MYGFVKINIDVWLNNKDGIIGKSTVIRDENGKVIFIIVSPKEKYILLYMMNYKSYYGLSTQLVFLHSQMLFWVWLAYGS